MALFQIQRRTLLPAPEAWQRVTDWRRHGAYVPLTRITVTPAEPVRPGTVVLARTGIGPLAFNDPMEIVRWEPPTDDTPGFCRLEKRGSVVLGWAEIEVRTRGGGSQTTWREEARLRGLPRLFDAPTAWGGRLVFGRAVSELLRYPA
ncbi:SRPBCC family protein [Streptomyces sp. HC44]|uniref:SRPBCC family protein n=1 Tax=Streptomyces scabichelini TaxID=2711217 RepID=A0A6G4UX91_9ACTN|nr:SRPBCC family protein [Streptomyces scabichelini]